MSADQQVLFPAHTGGREPPPIESAQDQKTLRVV